MKIKSYLPIFTYFPKYIKEEDKLDYATLFAMQLDSELDFSFEVVGIHNNKILLEVPLDSLKSALEDMFIVETFKYFTQVELKQNGLSLMVTEDYLSWGLLENWTPAQVSILLEAIISEMTSDTRTEEEIHNHIFRKTDWIQNEN